MQARTTPGPVTETRSIIAGPLPTCLPACPLCPCTYHEDAVGAVRVDVALDHVRHARHHDHQQLHDLDACVAQRRHRAATEPAMATWALLRVPVSHGHGHLAPRRQVRRHHQVSAALT